MDWTLGTLWTVMGAKYSIPTDFRTIFNTASSAALRFHCADGCWDRTQDRGNWCIGSQTLRGQISSAKAGSHPQLGQISSALGQISSATRLDLIGTRLDLIRNFARSHPHTARSHPQLGQISSALGQISSAQGQISSATRLDLIRQICTSLCF